MCLKCYGNMSEETFDIQISRGLTNPRFEKWNTASLSFPMIGACSRTQPAIREICITLLEMYLKWRHDNVILCVYDHYDYYVPLGGGELMYSKEKMALIIEALKDIDSKFDYELHEDYLKKLGIILNDVKENIHEE